MLVPTVRRFSPADLNSSAGWIMQRLQLRYLNKSEGTLANWLRMMTNRNDCLFIRTDHAIALAEVVYLDFMNEHPVVWERFVICEDRQNINHIDEAVTFYEEFKRWAKSMSVEKVIVFQNSDVPRERIKEVFRRLSTEEISFARV